MNPARALLALWLVCVAVNVASLAAVADPVMGYIFDHTIFADCFPQVHTCSVEAACAFQESANRSGMMASGNYPGCPTPQPVLVADWRAQAMAIGIDPDELLEKAVGLVMTGLEAGNETTGREEVLPEARRADGGAD